VEVASGQGLSTFNQNPSTPPRPDEPDDPWNHFVTALTTDTSVPEKARPHLARWVSQWRREGGDESAAATTAFFEEFGRSPTLRDWQKP
jgi:hypothetical protein